MTTLHDSIKTYESAIALERLLSRRTLSILRGTFFFSAAGSIAAGTVLYYGTGDTTLGLAFFGLGIACSGLWLEQMLLFVYHNSYYFQGLNSIIGLEDETVSGATYDAAKVVLAKPDDIALAFCNSTFGSMILLRTGLSPEAVGTFLRGSRQRISAAMIILPQNEIFSLINLGKYLLSHDVGFKTMLKREGISEETFIGALRWVISSHHQEKRRQRWWSKDNLSRTQGIGQEWSYGNAFLLQEFSRDIRTSAVFSTLTLNSAYATEKIAEIETALARAKAANILIIGEPGVGKIDLVMEVQRRIETGKSLDAIASKQIITLDTNRLFAVHKDKQSLELTLISMLQEAALAGNIIIVIENLSTFIKEAAGMGVFIPELFDQYLSSTHLHIIATDTPSAYHLHLEPLGAFSRRFAEVLIETPDLSATIRLLEGIALQNEARYNLIFTYASLQALAAAADRYIVEGVMPDKAIELLIDVATKAQASGKEIISSEFVYEVVSEKTGIPTGPIGAAERDLLLHLEDRLHQQVVGQQRALEAIARSMRRARAGIQSAEKPIGSFLFLGPTGVGKTETAKALAKIFFGGEQNMQRIDMSEYSGKDALQRLIGDSEQSGTLPDMLREHAYCVLLLDEFEKASQAVHDIFLQILDEGNFTDGRGSKVNARNTIIIATSNAGSQLIIKTVQQRQELSHLVQEIINSIIRDGVFRPELINRFDSTIIFEPLNLGEQGQVASLMLGGLYERIKERGYDLQVSPELMEVLVAKGYSPEFGARPMQRVLQDIVEEKVAQKIIGGEVQKGDTILLTPADFTSAELAVAGM